MGQYLTTTRDRRVAAALGTLGVRIQVRTTLLEKEGKRVTRYLLDLKSVDGRWHTKRITAGWKSGVLQGAEPGHPFLTCMRAFENRERLLDFARAGKPCVLRRVPGTRAHQYVPCAEGLRGIARGARAIETGDLKMVAALGVAGFPVLRIAGQAGGHLFYLPAVVVVDGVPLDGIGLLRAWRADKASVPEWGEFGLAAYALHNRERLMDCERQDTELVLIRKPRSVRSAIVRADATDLAWDRVKEFFDE